MIFGSFSRLLPRIWQNGESRRHALNGIGILAGLGAGVASYAFLREPLVVRLERLTIHLPDAAGHLPHAGLRILHLSDTHFRGDDWREQHKIDGVRRACKNLNYDLLVHTGDFLHEDSGLNNVVALLDSLPRPKLGSFAVFGNHDYTTYSHSEMLTRSWATFCTHEQMAMNGTHPTGAPQKGSDTGLAIQYANLRRLVRFGRFIFDAPLDLKRTGQNDVTRLEAALHERGFQVLHNRCLRLSDRPGHADGIDLCIAGIEDLVEGRPNLRGALQDIPQGVPTLLLSHNPDILQVPEIERADVVLSGHTHGGQIVLPLLGAAHTQSEHLSRREVSGYLQRGKTQIYITRGVGEGIPLRLGASPQITLLTLVGQ